jgi:hypothetical protein
MVRRLKMTSDRRSLDFFLADLRRECATYQKFLELEDFQSLAISVRCLKETATLVEGLLGDWLRERQTDNQASDP